MRGNLLEAVWLRGSAVMVGISDAIASGPVAVAWRMYLQVATVEMGAFIYRGGSDKMTEACSKTSSIFGVAFLDGMGRVEGVSLRAL